MSARKEPSSGSQSSLVASSTVKRGISPAKTVLLVPREVGP